MKRSGKAARFLAALVCLAMLGGMYAVIPAEADTGVKTITGLGTGVIGNPTPGAGGWSKVYFGSKEDPISFNVLSTHDTQFGGHYMLLDCDHIVEELVQGTGTSFKSWKQSSLRSWLNNDFMNSSFSTEEIDAIAHSNKIINSIDSHFDGHGSGIMTFEDVDEKIFLLDAREVTNPSYGFEDSSFISVNRAKQYNDVYKSYFLRSTCYVNATLSFGVIGWSGHLSEGTGDMGHGFRGVSPTLNVKLSSILFSSEVASGYYKLTILDPNLSISLSEGILPIYDAQAGKVFLPACTIGGSNAENATRVSAVITDGTWSASGGWSSGAQLLYYGEVENSGVITITLPAGFDPQQHHIYLLAEDVNDGNATDYGSAPVEVKIPDHFHGEAGFYSWPYTDRLPETAGSYVLTGDVTLDDSWEVPEGTVSLCLNGHSVTMDKTASSDSPVIFVGNNSTLNLYDCASVPGRITHDQSQGENSGSGVAVNGGTFNIYGGTISGNSKNYGGGVYLRSGTFLLAGGAVSGNTAVVGGGVYLGSGTFTLSGGTVSGNTATRISDNPNTGLGGGVYADGGTIHISGGTIRNNSAAEGGGIYNFAGLSLSGTIDISGNTGGDLFHDNLSPVQITGALATVNPIGISLSTPGIFTAGLAANNPNITANNITDYFIGDEPGQDPVLTAEGEAALGIHAHSWSYTVDGASITAVCGSEDCPITEGLVLTVSVPDQVYDGQPKEAALNEGYSETAFPAAVITYRQGDIVLDAAPADPGTYTASVGVGTDGDGGYAAEASVTYTIRIPVTVAADPKTKAYGEADPEFTAVVTGLPEGGQLNYTLEREAGEDVGEYAITVVPGDNPEYEILAEDSTLTIEKADAVALIVPAARENLVYNDFPLALVTEGYTTHGTLEYALGDDDQTAPEDGWSTDVPKASDADTRYVWYRITADDNHNDLAPVCLTTVIALKPITGATVELSAYELAYAGLEQNVRVKSVKLGRVQLQAADYEVGGETYGTDEGIYTVTVTGKGNYTGSAEATWQITGREMFVVAEDLTVPYDGEAHGIDVQVYKPFVEYTILYGTDEASCTSETCPTLTKPGTLGICYKVTAPHYEDYMGFATVTVTADSPDFGTADLVLPEDTTVIDESAFENDTKIIAVDAHNCTFIGRNAFTGCAGLTKIRLPGNCNIDQSAFDTDHLIYVFAPAGGTTQAYCTLTTNSCIFAEERENTSPLSE